MRKTIIISSLDDGPFPHCHLEIDEYVPLRFRTYDGTLGVKYLRWGNFSSSLLEFLLDPISMAIRGFTLTSFDAVHQPRAISSELPGVTGLPIVAITEGFKGPIDAQRMDVLEGFSVGFGEDFAEIDLGGFGEANRVIENGPIEYYVHGNYLVGLRVIGLTPKQLSMLRAQQGG